MKSEALVTILITMLLCTACARKPGADVQARLEEAFQQSMSGVTLVGHSMGPKDEGVAGEERYVIEKVSKLGGDTWLITLVFNTVPTIFPFRCL